MKKTLIALFVIFQCLCSFAQTHIKGFAPKYANEKIALYRYNNLISRDKTIIDTTAVDSNGIFNITINNKQIEYIFIQSDNLIQYFFVKPNTNIEVEIKEKEQNTNNKNPYKHPVYIAANVISGDDNFSNNIAQIDKNADAILITSLKSAKQKIVGDSLLNIYLKNKHNDTYIENYKQYRAATIEYTLKLKSAQDLQNNYIINKPILPENLAYMDLFTMLYEKFFLHQSQRRQGREFANAINSGSISQIKNIMQKNDEIKNNDFCELLILQNAYSEFYDSNFSRSALLKIIDSVALQTKNEKYSQIAQQIHAKITKLLAGYTPPDFNLKDFDGNAYTLKSFAEKPLYLGFFSVNSYSCIQDLYMMQDLYKKYGNKIQFVSVCVDSKEDVKNFVENNKLNWFFLDCASMPQILADYDVRTLPTYFFIDKNGKLKQSPAPPPSQINF